MALKQSILLFITASIWGSGFIAQSIGMNYVEPFTFTFFRTMIGAIFLIPIILLFKKIFNKPSFANTNKSTLLKGSLFCGILLFAAESFQQYGLVDTEAGKTGFITSMYIIFVPIINRFLGKKLSKNIILAIILSIVGLYLLCIKQDLTIQSSDILILICAVIFSLHIIVISIYVDKVDGLLLSCGQFFIASFIAFFAMIIFDNLNFNNIILASKVMIYAGIMSNGVAYTLQIIGQRGINPTIATLILSLESVMAVILGYIFLNEQLSSKEIIGAILMFSAVIIAQINFKFRGKYVK